MQSNLDLRVVGALIEEREAQMRRTSLLVMRDHPTSRRTVRRWIGQRLVRLGAWLAGEPAMRPVRAR